MVKVFRPVRSTTMSVLITPPVDLHELVVTWVVPCDNLNECPSNAGSSANQMVTREAESHVNGAYALARQKALHLSAHPVLIGITATQGRWLRIHEHAPDLHSNPTARQLQDAVRGIAVGARNSSAGAYPGSL